MSVPHDVKSLDADIDSTREEVRRLAARKSALEAALLSDVETVTRLSSKANQDERRQLDLIVQWQARQNQQDALRICVGATVFDPSTEGPLSGPAMQMASREEKRPLLGVRLERSHPDSGQYLEPCYLMLGLPDGEEAEGAGGDATISLQQLLGRPLVLTKHNLPAHVPVRVLEQRHLLMDPNGPGGDMMTTTTRLRDFVEACQRRLSAA